MKPRQGQLDKWYKSYGPLFHVKVEDSEFICREMTRSEYKKVVETEEDELLQEEEICKLCVLWPEDMDLNSQYAGLPHSMAVEILRESGFGDSPKVGVLMEKHRQEMEDFMNQVSCIIHEAFPMLDLEEIESWHLEKTLWYFSRAEWKLRHFRGLGQQDMDQGGVEGSNPEDFPELAAEKAFMSGKMTK